MSIYLHVFQIFISDCIFKKYSCIFSNHGNVDTKNNSEFDRFASDVLRVAKEGAGLDRLRTCIDALNDVLKDKEPVSASCTAIKRAQTRISKFFVPTDAAAVLLRQMLFFADAGVPFNVTQLPSYKAWMSAMQQQEYLMPRGHLERDMLLATFHAVRQVQLEDFKAEKIRSFSLTFDGWSSRGRKSSFVAVTRYVCTTTSVVLSSLLK